MKINQETNVKSDKKKYLPGFLVLFLIISLGVCLASVIKPDVQYSLRENRSMAYFSGPRPDTVWSGEYFENFETYCLDQMVGRDMLIQANSSLQRCFGKREINNVLIGKDDCLLDPLPDYTKAYEEATINETRQAIEDQLDTLLLIKEYTDSYGGKLYYADVYPREDYYAKMYPFEQNEFKKLHDALREERLKAYKNAGINVVDASEDYENHPDEKLYYYTDCHYSFKGAYYLYQEFLKQVRENGDDELYYPEWDDMTLISYDAPFEGSYIKLNGDMSFEYNDKLEYAIPDDYPTEYERFECGEPSDDPIFRDVRESGYAEYSFMDGVHANTRLDTHRDELPSILVIGNSFSQAFEALSIYNFGTVHGINPGMWQGTICGYIKEYEPDYVVMLSHHFYEESLVDGITFHE